jgi:hypothetical protein
MYIPIRCFVPDVKVYLDEERLLNPYEEDVFRGDECFTGGLKGWKRWANPSPEPEVDQVLNNLIMSSLASRGPYLAGLHDRLLDGIIKKVKPEKLLLVGILRAGLFVSVGLAQRLQARNYRVPVVAVGLFHEAGIDKAALERISEDYPDRIPVFVDGWTGRGVVARELKSCLPESILATLVDPGHHGDLWGTDIDTLVESAHFTATETLGFSRAYIKDPTEMWKAYKYPDEFQNEGLIKSWIEVFSKKPVFYNDKSDGLQNTGELLAFLVDNTGIQSGQWKVNINEVVRALVNRNPLELVLASSIEDVAIDFPTVLHTATKRKIPIIYIPEMRRRFNCLAAVLLP